MAIEPEEPEQAAEAAETLRMAEYLKGSGRRRSRREVTVKAAMMLSPVVIPLFLLGLVFLWYGLPSFGDGPLTCGDRAMRPHDTCVYGTPAGAPMGVGAEYTYEDMLERRREDSRASPSMLAVGVGHIALGLLLVWGGATFLHRRQSRHS
ncbi:hypothetical protein ABZ707_32635 [Streptomyces sp. NPDC006923]|uniref:hypothetical protein n=1 Tax=Streptomyces sp. NPDC006923 TaxID=3155355 RepID=UPI0033EE934A